MSAHYRFYAPENDTIVPWNASYQFPSQANKAVKSVPRLVPKNGAVFVQGNTVRFEAPATGYMNPANTTFIMDVSLYVPSTVDNADATKAYHCRFQNNIQSIFQRLRVGYGSSILEDIIDYNIIVRCMTEWTTNSPALTIDQSSINEGIGGVSIGVNAGGKPGIVNIRSNTIQGVSGAFPASDTAFTSGTGLLYVPYTNSPVQTPGANEKAITRRYQFQILSGLFQQPKLLPLKFMASQFWVEFTLDAPQNCIVTSGVGSAFASFNPYYAVGNFVMLPEILEFDPAYDEGFLQGLYTNGVPIPFASWHWFQFSSAQSTFCQLAIQERARSVKALFCVQRRSRPNYTYDNGTTLFDSGTPAAGDPSSLQQFQWRIGARYQPGMPVQCSSNNGSGTSNGGAEAYLELQKALNIVGRYELSTPCNAKRWAVQNSTTLMNEYDYTHNITGFDADGIPTIVAVGSNTNAFSTTVGAQCFAMATNLETTNGVEISGLNAEEVSDIALVAQWKKAQTTLTDATPTTLTVFSYYDCLFLLKQNNEGVLVC